MGPRCDCTIHVESVADRLEVVRVHAGAVPAQVIELHTWWDGAFEALVHCPMRLSRGLAALDEDLPVARIE
jgi:hypothetical protein